MSNERLWLVCKHIVEDGAEPATVESFGPDKPGLIVCHFHFHDDDDLAFIPDSVVRAKGWSAGVVGGGAR